MDTSKKHIEGLRRQARFAIQYAEGLNQEADALEGLASENAAEQQSTIPATGKGVSYRYGVRAKITDIIKRHERPIRANELEEILVKEGVYPEIGAASRSAARKAIRALLDRGQVRKDIQGYVWAGEK